MSTASLARVAADSNHATAQGGGVHSVRWMLYTLRPHEWLEVIDYWCAWLVASGIRERTVALRRYQIGHLAEAHLNRSPWSLRTHDLSVWLASQEWAPETRKSFRSALRSFYGWACANGHTRRNPALGLLPVRTSTPPPRPTPERILERALAAASDRDRLILLLAAYGGLRCAEIAALQWRDVESGRLRVHGKGGRVRVIPMHPRLAADLSCELDRRRRGSAGTGWRYSCSCGCVFPGQSGGSMRPDSVGRIARGLLGDGWSAHTLRHRFATRVYAGSHDLLAVQALLGHSKPETTKRYTDLSDESLAVAIATV